MIYKEVEFKYDAKNITLDIYSTFLNKSKYEKILTVSGMDHFYGSETSENSFYRLREGAGEIQLTYKSKTVLENNFIRVEHNLELKEEKGAKQKAEAYINDMGYTYRGSLFKTSFIYTYDYYIVAYYLVYDTNHDFLGKFIEIEIKEDHPWASEEQMFKELVLLEKMHKDLGLKKSGRLNQSLFEMFMNKKGK